MTRILVAVALFAILMAGCAGKSTVPEAPEPLDLVHRTDGIDALPDAFGGQLPVGTLRPLQQAAREPTLGVAPDGGVFVGVWDQEEIPWPPNAIDDDELGNVLAVYASWDQGASWRDVKPAPAAVAQIPPTTSDAFLEVDPVTGRVFTDDWTYGCSTMAFSDDGGGSWTYSPLGCGIGNGMADHQSITTGVPRVSDPLDYPRMVYYCVTKSCASSIDGGLTFGPAVCVDGSTVVVAECRGGMGHVKTDQEGRVLLGLKVEGMPWITVSEDDGATWRQHQINSTHGVYWHDVEMAADSNGTYYAAWQAMDGFPYMASSQDLGRTWSPAHRISPPGITATGYLMLAAGGPGKVAFVFLGTDHPPAHIPGVHPSEHRGDMVGARWNAYITVTLDGDGPDPTFVSTAVNDPDDPVAMDACWPGYRDCDDVGEFIDIVIGPDGRPWASIFDSCQRTCHQTGANEPRGGHRGAVATLHTGPALGDEPGMLAPLPYVQGWQEAVEP